MPSRCDRLATVASMVCLGGYLVVVLFAANLVLGAIFLDLLLEDVATTFFDATETGLPGPITRAIIEIAWWLLPACITASALLIAAGTRRVRSYRGAAGLGVLSALAGLGPGTCVAYLLPSPGS